jgi:hypothetical protein
MDFVVGETQKRIGSYDYVRLNKRKPMGQTERK